MSNSNTQAAMTDASAVARNSATALTFRVGDYRFCVPADEVVAIVTLPSYRRLPQAPAALVGLFDYRGQVVHIVSLRRKFGLAENAESAKDPLIIVRISCGLTGFWADEVLDVIPTVEHIKPPDPVLGIVTDFDQMALVDDQVFLVTDFERIFKAADALAYGHRMPPAPETKNRTDPCEHDTECGLEPVGGQQPAAGDATGNDATSFAVEPDDRQAHGKPSPQVTEPVRGERSFHHRHTPGSNAASLVGRIRQRSPNGWQQSRPMSTVIKPTVGNRIAHRTARGRRETTASAGPAISHLQSRSGHGTENRPPRRSDHKHRRMVWAGLVLLLGFLSLHGWLWLNSPVRVANTENQIPPQPAARDKGVQAIPMTSTPAVLSAKDTPRIEPAPAGRMHADRSVAGPIGGVDPAENLVTVASRHSRGSAPETAADTGPLGDEWLRVETSDFTLTIERPTAATQAPSSDANAAPQSQTLHHRSSWSDDATLFTHIVVRGDTLWDIAADYLGDPFRYPELADLSRIKDPHWIYPGDRIRIRKKTGQKEAMVKTPRQP